MSQTRDRPNRQRRQFLKTSGAATLATPWIVGTAKAAGTSALDSLRDKVEHIVVIYQENRSFDHYFGAYTSPHGHAVENLLDVQGNVDPRFHGLQKNPAGGPMAFCPWTLPSRPSPASARQMRRSNSGRTSQRTPTSPTPRNTISSACISK